MGGGMRIDTTIMPLVPGMMAAPGQPGQTQSFDAFFSVQHGDDAETAAKGTPVLSPYVFGFDTVGLLGLGAGAGVDTPPGPLPQGAAVRDAPPVHPFKGAMHRPAALSTPSIPYAAFSSLPRPAPPGAEPTSAMGEAVPAPAAMHARMTMPAAGMTVAARSGGAVAYPVSAGQAQVVAAPTIAATASPATPGFRMAGDDTAKDVQAPRRAQAAFRFEPDAEALSGQVSVAVSEGEELLHIVAAVPGLTKGDRQTLKAVADEAAAEAGIKLGELRLNGVVVRQFSKTT